MVVVTKNSRSWSRQPELSWYELQARSALSQGDDLIGHMNLFVDAHARGKPVPEATSNFFAKVFDDFLRRESAFLDADAIKHLIQMEGKDGYVSRGGEPVRCDELRVTDVATRCRALAEAMKLELPGRGAPEIASEESAGFRRALQVEKIVQSATDRDGKIVRVHEAVTLVADHMHASESTVRGDRREQRSAVSQEMQGYVAVYEDIIVPTRECLEIAKRLLGLARSSDDIEPIEMSIPIGAVDERVTITFPFDREALSPLMLDEHGIRALAQVVAACAPKACRHRVFSGLTTNFTYPVLRDLGRKIEADLTPHVPANVKRGLIDD